MMKVLLDVFYGHVPTGKDGRLLPEGRVQSLDEFLFALADPVCEVGVLLPKRGDAGS